MNPNINTQHTLFCITSSSKSEKASAIQGNITVAVALDMSKVFDRVNKINFY